MPENERMNIPTRSRWASEASAWNPRVAVLVGGLAAAGTGLAALARVRRHGAQIVNEPLTAT